MFSLVSGPFSPYLESALVDHIEQIKSRDRQTPITILLPSNPLRRRVRWLLSVESGCALYDVHVLTFHQLALRLSLERQSIGPVGEDPNLEIVGDHFYEYLLSRLLKDQNILAKVFPRAPESSGMAPALWQTIRDLREGLVDPTTALTALKEEMFEPLANRRLQAVFTLHAALSTWSHQLGVGLPDDITNSIMPWVPHSPFLGRMGSVVYYGFYDITQLQLSLLEAIAKNQAVTVFFPLGSRATYGFARQFLEQHLLKGGVSHRSASEGSSGSSRVSHRSESVPVQTVNVVGVQGELTYTCKAIWHIVEDLACAFPRIGVVSRNLDEYLPHVSRIFRDHHIPFWTTATQPLLQDPIAKVWWQFAGLREEHYGASGMLDVLTAPLHISQKGLSLSEKDQASLWRQAIRHVQIIRGREDWERLCFVANDQQVLESWEQWSGLSPEAAKSVLQQLARTVSVLIQDCEAIPLRGTFSQLNGIFESTIRKHGLVPDGPLPEILGEGDVERWKVLMEGFEEALLRVEQLDRVGEDVSWSEWMKEFRLALESIHIPLKGQSQVGVSILDAMSARGYVFDVLFILGMNDQVFPRIVKEDAFLRDQDRRVLVESLGYKIQEKLKGFEEEALLFQLLLDSAREKIYLVFQRMDYQGRPLGPSSFLRERGGSGAEGDPPEIQVPLRILEQVNVPYFGAPNETTLEHRLRALLRGRAIPRLGEGESSWGRVLQNGLEAVTHLDHNLTRAGDYDGILVEDHGHWDDLVKEGLAPTALEQYVQCPMRYWMKYGLQTRDIRETVSRQISMRVCGELGHRALKNLYQRWIDERWTNDLISSLDRLEHVEGSVRQIFDRYATRYGTGYVVVWDWIQENFVKAILDLMEHDRQDFLATGFQPERVEVDGEGKIPMGENQRLPLIPIRGRLDRVDQNPSIGARRIVDYKFSESRRSQFSEIDLVNEGLRGTRLQPPLYALFSGFGSSKAFSPERLSVDIHPSVEFRFLRPFHSQSLGVGKFPGSTWDQPVGAQLLRTVHAWLSGLQNGKFFFIRGNYCTHCVWSVACRVRHHPSWTRAFSLPLAREFRRYRKQRPVEE